MIESFLTQATLTSNETAVGDYLRTGQSDFSAIWRKSFGDMVQDFIDQNFVTRTLCKRYVVQAEVTKTDAFTGEMTTAQDYAQRTRLVIPISAQTGDAVFALQGTDDEGTTYEDIFLITNAGASAVQNTILEADIAVGNEANSYVISRPFKQYRLKLISIGTTTTYSAYMVEEMYTTLHRDKTMANIYRSLMAVDGDVWEGKHQEYMERYQERLNSGRFYVDTDDDGSIEEGEAQKDVQQDVRFRP